MKKKYLRLLASALLLTGTAHVHAQSGCALSNTTNLHNTGCQFSDQIDYFELDGVSNSSGCASNGYYTYYTAPVWTLQIGQTYTWTADVGNFSWQQGFAFWIDLDNNGFFTSGEQLGNGGTPAFTHSGTFQVPFSATPGAGHRLRLRCDFATSIGNTNQTACEQYGPPNFNFDYGETEDYDVYLLPAPPCTGTPAANSIVGPTTSICPNSSAMLGLATTYSFGGMTYVWQSSTVSAVGPWTTMSGTNLSTPTGSLTQNTWYQAVIACSNSGASITTSAFSVAVQNTVVDSIPYFESFEGITENDQLPNCSWAADNLGSEAFTYTISGTDNRFPRTGNNFASYYYWPGNTNAFYTNGIYLQTGITYSATVWYITNMWGDDNWEDFSLLLGPSQSATGQMTIASTPGPAISPVYKALTNTFTVASTGVYYVGIQATSNTNAYAPYLTWDDLEITAPCALNPVSLNMVTATGTVCEGDQVSITASGADTYSWSNGGTGNAINFTASNSGLYTVVGTSTLTGCQASASTYITVNDAPFVAVVADKPAVCSGGAVNLTAVGDATSYNWSNSGVGNVVTVNPTTGNNTFSVTGTNAAGCSKTASIQITVNPIPNVQAAPGHTPTCAGDQVMLTGSGAQSFQWQSGSNFIQSNPATILLTQSMSYTVYGTDANGCTGSTVLELNAEECTGVAEQNGRQAVSVYPNPGDGMFMVNAGTNVNSKVTVIDITGRTVFAGEAGSGITAVNLKGLAAGMYYFRIDTGDSTSVVRVIKN